MLGRLRGCEEMMTKPIAFLIRCKPQDADIIELVKEHKRVFLGYPPFKKKVPFNPENIKSCMFDIGNEEFDYKNTENPDWGRQYTTHIHLINDVTENSLVLVPRPELGICYVGTIDKWELINKPKWIKQYKQLRSSQKLLWDNKKYDEQYHIGDIVQSWKLKKVDEIPLFILPGWIRHSLFGRQTTGRIKNDSLGIDMYKSHEIILNLLKDKTPIRNFSKTDDKEEIRKRLINFLTPQVFEHFICEILQLREPNCHWWHVGGSGDGGVDCIGFNKNGEVISVVQCKLQGNSVQELSELCSNMKNKFLLKNDKIIYIACDFYCNEKVKSTDNPEIWNQDKILNEFLKVKSKSVYSKRIGID